MVVLHPTESGVRTVFGVPESTVLKSGLHWKLPIPFGEIHRVSTHRIEQLSIGHSEELEELDGEGEPESILWANQHVSEEFLLLLGDGHDVISADGVLEYRISNVHDYLFESQNPEEVLESVVYQVLMDQTSSRTLEEALSENLTELAKTVTNDIQERMAEYRLGIEPIVFTFTALHPPVSVAKDYQEVVSAQIDVLTKKYRAEQYRLQSLPKARAEKVTGIELAKQDAAHLLASARGESASFEGLRQTVRQAQDLYRFRVRQDNLQKIITGKSVIILDHRLEQEGATLWIEP
jgi:membrane protease subunit HflK